MQALFNIVTDPEIMHPLHNTLEEKPFLASVSIITGAAAGIFSHCIYELMQENHMRNQVAHDNNRLLEIDDNIDRIVQKVKYFTGALSVLYISFFGYVNYDSDVFLSDLNSNVSIYEYSSVVIFPLIFGGVIGYYISKIVSEFC